MYRGRDAQITAIGETDLIHRQMTGKWLANSIKKKLDCLIITDVSIKKFPKAEPKESGKEKRKEREEKTQNIFSFEIVLATQNASSYTRKEFFN